MVVSFRSRCPISSALDIVGDRWSLVLLRSMLLGAATFGDFQRAPERIASNILADRLKKLEAEGIIRRVEAEADRRRYELTAKGADLIPVLQALARWGEQHIPERWRPPEAFYQWPVAPHDESNTARDRSRADG